MTLDPKWGNVEVPNSQHHIVHDDIRRDGHQIWGQIMPLNVLLDAYLLHI